MTRLSTVCLCRSWATDACGPSGWTRTTTSRVKSPACCVDTTKGLELMPSGLRNAEVNSAFLVWRDRVAIAGLGRRPYHGRMLPLHHISVGANDRIRTDTARLGRPAGSRYPTFALLVRPTGFAPVLPRWRRGVLLPHPGRTAAGVAAGLLTSFSCQRARSFRTDWWAAWESNPVVLVEEAGLQPARGPSASYRPVSLATVPGFEPG